jgi:TolB-like protein/Tfp pilus assembly protein PilF
VNPRNFFAELKRRNVYKVAIAYAVVAWLLMQIATQVFPFLEIPNWAIRLVIMLIVIGFPIALVIAWAFELTPEGLKRTESADELPTKTSRSRAWIYVVLVAGAISVSLFFLGRYTRSKQSGGAELPVKSIAVLPFENLSHDPDNAYFADGIQEEILTRLARIADLKVISRTSTQQYQSKPGNLSEIAKQLGVANILEGSVQKAGDSVRVNVNLIQAASDSHLWADTYDRKLTDIFGVESEIAKAITETLQAKLTGSEEHALSVRPTDNPVAHELYLKGRFFWNKRTANDLKKSVDYFNQAIEADPNYALAYAGLADVYVLLPGFGSCAPKDCYPKAKAAATKALELDATLAEAHTSLAMVLSFYDFNFSQATVQFKRAIELKPNYATAHQWYGGHVLATLGRFDEAIAQEKKALELDPLSLIAHTDLANTYLFARRPEEAIDELRKVSDIDPNFYSTYWNLGLISEMKGDFAGAIGAYQKARDLNDNSRILALLAHAYGSSGNKTEAMKILEQLKQLSNERYVTAYSFALVYLGLGDKEEALRWLEKSYQDRAGQEIGYIRVSPLLNPLRGDPRFEALVEKIVPLDAK